MIRFIRGNIFASGCEALVNPVNCVGVMGKGLALQFKQRFPANFDAYRAACRRRALFPGSIHVFDTGNASPHFVLNFPTKVHWRDRSHILDIDRGLRSLPDIIQHADIASIAIPPIGCGLGGLPWPSVRDLIVTRLSTCHDIDILVYEPALRS